MQMTSERNDCTDMSSVSLLGKIQPMTSGTPWNASCSSSFSRTWKKKREGK